MKYIYPKLKTLNMKYLPIIILLAFASCKENCTTCNYTLTGYNSLTEDSVTESGVYDQDLEGKCDMLPDEYEKMRRDELQNTVDLQNGSNPHLQTSGSGTIFYDLTYTYTLECD